MFRTEIKIETMDAVELSLVQQCVQVIEQYRNDQFQQLRQAARAEGTAQQQQPVRVAELNPTNNEQANEPTPSPVPAPEASEKDAVDALRQVLQKTGAGIPAARELFEKLGVQKVSELSPSGRAAFVLAARERLDRPEGAQ